MLFPCVSLLRYLCLKKSFKKKDHRKILSCNSRADTCIDRKGIWTESMSALRPFCEKLYKRANRKTGSSSKEKTVVEKRRHKKIK